MNTNNEPSRAYPVQSTCQFLGHYTSRRSFCMGIQAKRPLGAFCIFIFVLEEYYYWCQGLFISGFSQVLSVTWFHRSWLRPLAEDLPIRHPSAREKKHYW